MGIFNGCLITSDVDDTLVSNGYINPKNVEKIEYFKLLTRYSIDDILGLEEAGLIYKLNKYKT